MEGPKGSKSAKWVMMLFNRLNLPIKNGMINFPVKLKNESFECFGLVDLSKIYEWISRLTRSSPALSAEGVCTCVNRVLKSNAASPKQDAVEPNRP
ncbi:hypothetical protein E1180_10380 [Roseibium denhamense]|uniref:Uncharacterized protein n=1 Tax=Roseibium denhamense TaxID=76305 RepID=A0ABY1PMC5_9HYPH|nr:hypothetical protein [Roseibium denhamense]MTI05917.1 hypothetical protein [Roseibium denhamense]SMP35753.1 hypothetical protein SAMN06265374_4097 [Roseibium denhamense]